MSKRQGSFQNNINKRPKLDEDVEWDDDLDDDVWDKCLEIASQVEQVPSTNTTLLPSYDSFKKPTTFAHSTQATSVDQLQNEIKKLRTENAEKTGEISVLRSKIKEASSQRHADENKTVAEWRQQMVQAQKEATAAKSELECKNLEVLNLKHEIAQLRRDSFECTQRIVPVKANPESSRNSNGDKTYLQARCRHPIISPLYPLKSLNPDHFREIAENHLIKTITHKISRITIPYLQNQQISDKRFSHKCPKVGNNKVSLSDIYGEVFTLTCCSVEEINHEQYTTHIDKILTVGLIVLKDLSDYVQEYVTQLKTEDIQQNDIDYLTGSSSNSRSKIGIQASKILQIVSLLIPYNHQTAEFICNNGTLKSNSNYTQLIAHRNNYNFLKIVLEIVKNVGKHRLTKLMEDFLSCVITLLKSVAKLGGKYMDNVAKTNRLFCYIFKEIVFSRPEGLLLEKLTGLLKICSSNTSFISFLFQSNNNSILDWSEKGVVNFNDESCCFCVLSMLLQNYAMMEQLPLDVVYNMLNFMYDTFKNSNWVHHENTDKCLCLSQLYKIEIDFVCRGVEALMEQNVEPKWTEFLNHQIVQKVLKQIYVNNLELSHKHVMTCAQLSEGERTLTNANLFNPPTCSQTVLSKLSPQSFCKDF